MTESNLRTLVKTVLWRITGSSATLLISWIVLGDITTASGIAALQLIANTVLYYVYERIWVRINWGRY
jgi:uncharacterized membrane protein